LQQEAHPQDVSDQLDENSLSLVPTISNQIAESNFDSSTILSGIGQNEGISNGLNVAMGFFDIISYLGGLKLIEMVIESIGNRIFHNLSNIIDLESSMESDYIHEEINLIVIIISILILNLSYNITSKSTPISFIYWISILGLILSAIYIVIIIIYYFIRK
jgi:hypothetical protein